MQRLYKSSARRGSWRPTIMRADAEAIQIEGPQRGKKGGNKESMQRIYKSNDP